MFNERQIKQFIISGLSFVFVLMIFPLGALASPEDAASKVQEKLQGISAEEREVLQDLFDMEHEIEGMEEQEKVLEGDMEVLSTEIKGLEKTITDEEKSYQKKRDVLKQVLKVYQRQGPGSYLEIILDSENLNMFLWRLSTLQDLSRNTEEILKSLEESGRKLTEKKEGITEKLALMEGKRKQLRESLDKKLQLKEDKEKYLTSLKENKADYLEQLDNIQQMWDELRLLYSKITGEFANIVKDGNLPMNAMDISFTSRGIEASIDEKTFNHITAGYPSLSEMAFGFYPGRVEIRMPKKNHVLTGTFEVIEGNTLKFEAQGGSFYEMPLETGTIEELFREGYLMLDLKPLLGSNILKSVEISQGQLRFVMKLMF